MEWIIVKNIIRNPESVSLSCCFKKDDEYVVLTPDLEGNEIQQCLQDISLNAIGYRENLNQVAYDPVGVLADTVETCSTHAFESIGRLLSKLDSSGAQDSGELKPEQILFFTYEFCDLNIRKVWVLRRHNRLRTLRKGFFARFSGNSQLKKIEESKILGVDDQVDLIIFNNEVTIFNHVAFERIFDVKNEFIGTAKSILDSTKLREHILNYERFQEDVLNNMSFVKRISKLQPDQEFAFTSMVDKTKVVVQKFDLSIKIDQNNKFVYQDRSELGDYINLMQDAYYETYIGGIDGIDKGR